jgi:hypothetical protein
MPKDPVQDALNKARRARNVVINMTGEIDQLRVKAAEEIAELQARASALELERDQYYSQLIIWRCISLIGGGCVAGWFLGSAAWGWLTCR